VVPTSRGKPVLRANLLSNIANLSIEQEYKDDFSSDSEGDSEDDFYDWSTKSGVYISYVINWGGQM
jgi:hypothetical protein